MASIARTRRARRATSQAQQPSPIDWSNDLTAGLELSVVPGLGDLVGGALHTLYGGAGIGERQRGRVYTSSSTSADAVAVKPGPGFYSRVVRDLTISLRIEVTAYAAYSNYFSIPYRAGSWSTPYNSLVIFAQSTDADKTTLQWAVNSSGADYGKFSTNVFATGAGTAAHYHFVRSGLNISVYKNGALVETVTATGNTNIDFVNTQPAVLFNSSDSSLPNGGCSGYSDGFDVWSRALSAGEIASHFDNPHQLIRAPSRRLWLVAAGGSLTGALAESGVAADSCGATVIMAATGAESTAAADALAAYGLFTAQLAETAAGADSASSTAALSAARAEALAASDLTATGSLTMTGTISESGAAVDVPAASAQLAAAGAETLTANDATATGSATIAGSVSESGAAVDVLTATAQLAAQESESAVAADSQGAATVGGLLVAEVASSADVVSAVSLAAAAITEGTSGSETIGAATSMGATISEVAAAADASNPAGATIAAAITESGAATDQYSALLIAVAASLEQVAANATMSAMISAVASVMEAGAVFDTAWAIVAGQVVYARAPTGPGYAPHKNELATRLRGGNTTRPAAIQRNNR
jgi:hypothetical protein